MGLKLLLILILAAGLAPPVSAEGPAAPPPADGAAIRSHFAAFDAAFARGDAPGVAVTYADDAGVVRPGEPAVVGRAGIESFYREMFAGRMKGVRKGGTVDRIRLAGAFGAHIDPVHALVLGMVPDCDPGGVTAAGNAAGTGARIALLNRASRAEIADVVRRIEKIETAVEPRFQEHFVNAMAIPHGVDAYELLARTTPLPERRVASTERPTRRRERRIA